MQSPPSFLATVLASLTILSTTLASPLVPMKGLDERAAVLDFRMASVGDSWAAGQAVIPRDAYGGPDKWTNCYKHKGSWEALMAGDNSWTIDPIAFSYAACSGSKLEDLTTGDNNQISQVGSPQLLTMQSGGNNAHFGDILVDCIYVGDKTTSQRDYPDPTGGCFKTITTWEAYLDAPASEGAGKSFYFDHHDQLNKVLAADKIKSRPNIYLYVVGYGAFFSTEPGSEWCNDVSFGIVKSPKLNMDIRHKLNALTAKVNSIIEQSVSDLKNDNYKFYDPTYLFDNHRFCEPGHTLSNQYFLNDVWYWNMVDPEDDPDYATLSSTDTHETDWAERHIFFNGSQATEDQLLDLLDPANPVGPTGSGNPYDSWSGRSFHPKDGGHNAIKNGMIELLRNNKVAGIKAAGPPPTPPKWQPYATGKMHIHINEYWDCHDDYNNLSVEITMWDFFGDQVGYMARTQAGATGAARMGSKLEDQLVVTPEWGNGGYIQFSIGNFQFDTRSDKDDTQPTYCVTGGYDPREGPMCYWPNPDGAVIPNPGAYSRNQIDCYFPSPQWNGGNPSDGSSL